MKQGIYVTCKHKVLLKATSGDGERERSIWFLKHQELFKFRYNLCPDIIRHKEDSGKCSTTENSCVCSYSAGLEIWRPHVIGMVHTHGCGDRLQQNGLFMSHKKLES